MKLTKNEIEKRIKEKFPEYKFDIEDLKNTTTKIKLICPEHGEFEQTPKSLFNGTGCTKCSGKFHYTTKSFIEIAKQISPEYDYSLVNYKNGKEKIKLICPKHGEFEIRGDKILRGGKCEKCSSSYSLTEEEALIKAKQISPEYDYGITNFKNKNIKIICPVHGIVDIKKLSLLNGKKCYKCSHNVYSTEQFIEKAKQLHGNKYDYSLVEYINNRTRVKIICPEHGIFETTPQIHLKGNKCPTCNFSLGENNLKEFLKENNIKFEEQKKFSNLKDKTYLSYDFYIPSKNLLVEYNGIQHYKFNKFFHKDLHCFHKQLHHDWLKRKYAKDNNINLLVIPYWETVQKYFKLII